LQYLDLLSRKYNLFLIIKTMTQLDITQAKSNLSTLLDLVIKGEEIVITQDDRPVAKISPIKKPLKRGSAKGKVWMSDDFDEPLDDFKEYME
jgi:prevent-host-death family protein